MANRRVQALSTVSLKDVLMQRDQKLHGFIKKCCIVVAIATSMHAYSNMPTSSDEEAFLIRRIAEFWKDGDYAIVKAQINDFVKKHPQSNLKDYLHGILADLLLQEGHYDQALVIYKTISDPSIYEKTLLNRLQCYYELSHYEPLFKEGEKHLASNNFGDRKEEFNFIMAESYFRHALTLKDEGQKKTFLEKAQPIYENLSQSDYSDVSSFALADIYRSLKQNVKGVDLYLSLAEKHPDQKEALLFNAALLEASINKQVAIEIFDRVIALNGSKSGDASFNRLLLQFQTQNYDDVVKQHRVVYPHVPEDQMATFHFIVGKSFYLLQNYENAITPLEKYILDQKTYSNQYKDALLLQMTCANHVDNEPLFDKTLTRFKTAYPSDAELPKAYFMHAMLLKKQGDFVKVEQKLKQLVENSSSFSDQESLFYEYAIATHQNAHYMVSYTALQHFLTDFPESTLKDSAWRYFLSCCLHLSKSYETEVTSYSKDLFLTDLQKVLSHKNGLSEDEVREYRLLYAKLAYELTYYNNALDSLKDYIQDYPKDQSLGEAHLITALSLSKLNADPVSFCTHLETALELNPNLYHTGSIYLQLYNAYITRAQGSDQAHPLIDKAAYYLYSALQDNTQPIKVENQLWLAGYYYQRAKNYLEEHWTHAPGDRQDVSLCIDRALDLYNHVLSSDKTSLKNIDGKNLYLESEALKFAELAGLRNHQNKKIAILESLIEQQNAHSNWSWQFQRQAIFELANTYERINDLETALETYEFINEFPKVATPLTTACSLKTAKLRFELLDKKNKNEKNPEVVQILNQLKDLQIRKNALSEPYHLEAGLEYAKIRMALTPDSTKDSRYLFFLVRLKEDFTTNDDVMSNDYFSALKANKDQELCYTAYMKFVDAEILRMQAKQLHQEHKKEEAAEYKQKALALLTEIENNKAPSEYLHAEVAKSMKLLR